MGAVEQSVQSSTKEISTAQQSSQQTGLISDAALSGLESRDHFQPQLPCYSKQSGVSILAVDGSMT